MTYLKTKQYLHDLISIEQVEEIEDLTPVQRQIIAKLLVSELDKDYINDVLSGLDIDKSLLSNLIQITHKNSAFVEAVFVEQIFSLCRNKIEDLFEEVLQKHLKETGAFDKETDEEIEGRLISERSARDTNSLLGFSPIKESEIPKVGEKSFIAEMFNKTRG